MPSPVLILTTVGTEDDARRIASELVTLRLAACVNVISSMESFYRWQGSVHREGEILLIIKTMSDRSEELRAALISMHPYEVPEVLVITPDDLPDGYRAWLFESTRLQ